jgi:hypothetical protein
MVIGVGPLRTELGIGRKTEMDAFKRSSAGVGLGAGLKTEMDAFNRSSMERKADGILRSESSSDIKIRFIVFVTKICSRRYCRG